MQASESKIPDEFGVGLVLGATGAGKSRLLRRRFAEGSARPATQWDNTKAVVSHFESPKDAVDRLSSVGLNSIPVWTRPFFKLSMGQQARARLARDLSDGAVVDDFTATASEAVFFARRPRAS